MKKYGEARFAKPRIDRAGNIKNIDRYNSAVPLEATMGDDDVLSKLNEVQDADSFISFLQSLQQDWEKSEASERRSPSNPYAANAYGWENTCIGSFLEAATAGGTDNKNRLSDLSGTTADVWRYAAEIIMCGKVYE